LERDQKKGPWDSLPKKEVTILQKRLDRLDRYLGGLKGMRSLPRVVILVGQKVELAAIQECRKLGIPLICRLDTDCNPNLVDVGVPMNDDSVLRIRIFLKSLLPRIQEGRRWWFSRKVRKQRKKGFLTNNKHSRTFLQEQSLSENKVLILFFEIGNKLSKNLERLCFVEIQFSLNHLLLLLLI
jgi:small subunit ribosomal protein S2